VSALGEGQALRLLVGQAKSEEAYLIALAPLRHYRVSPPIEIREVANPSLTEVFYKLGSSIQFDSRRLFPPSEKRHWKILQELGQYGGYSLFSGAT
jgi:hypothetical protein